MRSGTGLSRDQLAIPMVGLLRRPLLCSVIDAHEPEAWSIAIGPFEIVEDRPYQIPAHIDTGIHRLPDRADMGVEERDSVGVMHRTAHESIGERRAVFRDDDRR